MFGYFENKVNELYKTIAPEESPEEKFLSAIASGNVAEVAAQIESGRYDVNMRNQRGNAPLHVAAFNGQQQMVNYLLEKGADPMAIGQRNNTCLHFAAVKGNLDLVKQFIQLGVSPLARNENGKSAYDVAEGFGIKQFLMPLMFKEEQRTGTAPTIVGATTDRSKELERLANLPPPPKVGQVGMSMAPPSHPQQQQQQQQQQGPGGGTTPGSGLQAAPGAQQAPPSFSDPNARVAERVRPAREIKPDGFVTTVNNPELAAKYGNTSNYRAPAVTSPQGAGGPLPPPTYNPGLAKQNPFAKARYVQYDAFNNTAAAPVQYPQQSPSAPAPSNLAPSGSFGGAQVWTPSPVDAQQQPMQQQQQPQPVQQQQQQQQQQPMYQQQQQQQQQQQFQGQASQPNVVPQPDFQQQQQYQPQAPSQQYSQSYDTSPIPSYGADESEEGTFN